MKNRRVTSFSNSYAVKSFISRNIAKLSTRHHLRIYLARALLETPCRFFGGNFSAPGAHRLVGFPYHAGNIIRRSTPMILYCIAWLS